MVLTPSLYYDHSKWSDTSTLTMMALETYFGNNIFRSDASRVIHASSDFAFRQRLNLLSKNGTPNINELSLPFMRYYRTNNWTLDTQKPGVQNATAGMVGFTEAAIGYQKLRFLSMIIDFNCTAYFSRSDDAQMAYEALYWISTPAPQQFAYGSVVYKGYNIDIPMQFNVENIVWMPTYNETEWLQKAKIIPIDFTIKWRTAILSQSPQSPQSDIFWDDSPPVITEHVLLDFLSYKYQNTYYDQSNISLEVDATFTSDPLLNGVVALTNVTTNSMIITWTYNPLCNTTYTTDIILNVNGVENFTVPMIQGNYTLTGLSPNSLYNITLWFTSLSGQVTKYVASTTTVTDSTAPSISGIIGF